MQVMRSVALAIASLAFAGPSYAQDEPKEGNPPFARVADDEETIYAVQRKAFSVEGKLELAPFVAATFADRFVQSFAIAGSLGYHLRETFAVEVFGSYMFPTESGLTREILDRGMLLPETAKLTQLLWAAGAGVKFSPLYGKVQVMGAVLGNLAFYVGAGFAIGESRVRCTSGQRLDPAKFGDRVCPMQPSVDEEAYEPATLRPLGAISGGVRFDLSEWLAIEFEVKDYIYVARVFRPEVDAPTQRYTDAVRNDLFAQLGVGILMGP